MNENLKLKVSFELLNDRNISSASLSLLLFLLSLPVDTEATVSYLSEKLRKSRSTISKYFKELIEAGYVFRYQERNENGGFGKWRLVVGDCKEEILKLKKISENL